MVVVLDLLIRIAETKKRTKKSIKTFSDTSIMHLLLGQIILVF